MTTLTDRYVWAVLRAVPTPQRADLEPEIRALIADATEAQTATGATAEAAERTALLELGDPETLADRYTDRTRALIGPRVYPEWWRIITLVVPIAVAIAGVVAAIVASIESRPVGEIVTSGLGAAFTAGFHAAFWITLVFAVFERTVGPVFAEAQAWSLDELPQVPSTERLGIGDAVASVIASLVLIAAILWVQLQP